MTIYVINGRTKSAGQWELEAYADYWKAIDTFQAYMDEYEADLEDKWYAKCKEGEFWIDVVEVIE